MLLHEVKCHITLELTLVKKKNLSNSATYMYSYSVYLYMYVVLFSAGCTEFNFYIVEF